MAVGKKSFVMYADFQELFNELSDNDAGQLIKHIFKYVNDENPETKNPIVKISFIQIKLQLKRDLDKWETQLEQRRQAGKKSAEVRSTKTNERSTVVQSRRRKPTDNVNVNVNVNDIKEIKGSEIDISPFDSDFMIHWETWLAYKKSQFGFRYKLLSSEQTAFNDLVKKANGEKLQAIAIINNSIANGWKGLIEMKNYYPQIEPLHSQTINRPIGTTKSMFE